MTRSSLYWRRHARLAMAAALAIAMGCSKSEPAATPKGPVMPVDPTTAGTIDVEVSYSGPPTSPAVINMSSTPACAKLHADPVLDPSLIVADGRLANAVVYIKSGLGDRGFNPPAEPVVIDQRGCLYDPHVAAVMIGQPLQFRNSDSEPHNVHGRPREVDGWNFLMSRPNSTRDVSFDKPEVGIPVSCDVHPWMHAYVSVFDNPYFAVTPPDGRVTLRQVPPGNYVVAAWQESLGTLVQTAAVPASGTAHVQFTFRAPERGG